MICVSLADSAIDEIEKILNQEDLVELRLESLVELDPIRICSHRAGVVATCRPKSGVSDAKRLAVLEGFVRAGAKYIDIEIEAEPDFRERLMALAQQHGCKVIISYHNFAKTPDREALVGIINKAVEMRADVIKIACHANSIRDGLRLVSFLEHYSNLVVVGMGEFGKLARVLGPLLGGLFTYASVDEQRPTAPGQLSAAQLRALYEQLAGLGIGVEGVSA